MNPVHATRTDYDSMSFFLKKFGNENSKNLKFPFLIFLFFIIILPTAKADFLTCPDDVTVIIDPCETQYFMSYDTLDWSSSVPLADTTFNPIPGEALNEGIHAASIVGEDMNGVISVCNFTLTVLHFSSSPVCDNDVKVSLEEDCEQEITWDMLLEGGPYCPDNMYIHVKTAVGNTLAEGASVNAKINWINKNYIYTMTDLSSGHLCWGQLEIVAPTVLNITCPADKTVFCVESVDPFKTGSPTFESCYHQGDIDVTYFDDEDFRHCPDSFDLVITRHWKIENPLGEFSQCQQTIYAKRFTFDDIEFPPNYDGTDLPPLQCEDDFSHTEIADTSNTKVPAVNGYFADKITCDFTVTFEDSITNVCGETWQIERLWRVIDWCSTDVIYHTQNIMVEDTKAPQFEIPDTIWVSSSLDCTNEAMIQPAVILEECDEISFEIELPNDVIMTNGGPAFVVLNEGIHEISYTLTDGCGNSATKTSVLIAETENLLSCPENMTVDCSFYLSDLETPLTNNDLSVLSQFGEPIFYTNCYPELSETINIQIDNCGSGVIERHFKTEDFGEEKSCLQNIYINHVSDFVVKFPDDLNITCGQTPPDLGEPEVKFADCENIEITYEDVVYDVVPDACYKIVRTWIVINHCVYDSTLHNFTIESQEFGLTAFPDCDLDGNFGCDQRTFKDGLNSSNYPNAVPDGIIIYQQTIKISDNTAPVFDPNFELDDIVFDPTGGNTFTLPYPDVTDCSDVSFEVSGDLGPSFGPFSNIPPGSYTILYKAKDQCGNSNAKEVTLNILCGTTEVICKTTHQANIDSNLCRATVYPYDLLEYYHPDCFESYNFSLKQSGSSAARSFGCFGDGEHAMTLWITDEDGNQDSCHVTVTVTDTNNLCIENELICKIAPAFDISSNSYLVQIEPEDLMEFPGDFCSGIPVASFSETEVISQLTYTCLELGDYPLEVWATYSDGTKDSCQTTVTIQDLGNICDNVPGYLDGHVINEDEEFISAYNMYLTSPSGHSDSLIDYPSGLFAFHTLEIGEDYTVTPKKDINYLNGVTTFDMVLIQKHILHVKHLETPYQLIAADVNNSGSITISDVVEIKKLVIHVNPTFPNNDSWRFVDQMYEFPDPQNPWQEPFPEAVDVAPFAGVSDCLIFIGMKIGDVNGSANPQLFTHLDERNSPGILYFETPDIQFEKGETVQMPFYFNNHEIEGYQFTLEFDETTLEFLEIVPGLASESDFGKTYLNEGILTTNWIKNSENEDWEKPAFMLVFNAKTTGYLSDFIEINSQYTVAEAYSNELEIMGVELRFDQNPRTDQFEIYPPNPNPFSEKTQIGFYLPESASVNFELFNAAGQDVFDFENEYEKGKNALEIKRSDIGENGIYFFKIQSNNEIRTGKLILN